MSCVYLSERLYHYLHNVGSVYDYYLPYSLVQIFFFFFFKNRRQACATLEVFHNALVLSVTLRMACSVTQQNKNGHVSHLYCNSFSQFSVQALPKSSTPIVT